MAQGDLPSRNLTFDQRAKVFDKTVASVTKQYFDPKFNGVEWPRIASESRERIIALDDPETFESGMHELVRKLGTSHTGFFHQSVRRIPSRLAIGVTFGRAETDSGPHWVAQDVHSGEPGHAAGLQPLDVLTAMNGKPINPPDAPMFAMGSEVQLRVRRTSQRLDIAISIPAPKSRQQPYASLEPVVSKKLSDDTGYLKVSILPGLLGLDVARTIDKAVADYFLVRSSFWIFGDTLAVVWEYSD